MCFNITTHIYTCVRPTCKFWLYSDASSAFFCETLICGPRNIYPLDNLLRGVARCSFLLFCVCLGHIYDLESFWSQVVAISYPVSPERVVFPSNRSRNSVFTLQRMHARGYACTRGLGYVGLNMTTHIYTCSRPICLFWLYSDAQSAFFLRNPDKWASEHLPLDVILRGVARCRFLLFFVCLVHMYDV